MNPQEKQQVAACDDKWVPFFKRVKISSTNIGLETTMPHKEETFQVVIDLIKNSTYFKAFIVSAHVPEIFMQQFWTVLDICPRVEGIDFTDVPDDDTALTFLIDLGYKGPLYKHTNMFVDHMHQPWRTLATIINKCLSGKTESNDKLRKSRIDILWGMFKRENVDYPELIWEEIAYQIDHGKEKRSRRENMPYPRFTKIIINHFLKQHKSLTNLNFQHCHTIKDDGIVSRLKFVRIGKDYQEYGLPIPETMLTEVIKQSESYQMFIKYSTGQIHPKKRRGKVKKKTSSKRIVKKKLTLYTDDNIISDDPDAEAEEADEARQVHATHARIVTESVPESTKKSGGRKEQEVADIMQALKESKKTSKRQPGTEGSNEGTGSKPGVPDESTVVSATSSEGTSIKLRVLDEENDITEEKKDDKDGDVDDEGDDHISDTQDADDEDVKTESDEDDIYKYKIRVRKDEDEEMINAEVDDCDKGDEEITDAAKADPEKNSEESLSTATATTLPPPSVSTTPSVPQQTTTQIPIQPIITDAPTITTAVPESNALTAVELRVAKLEKDVSELKTKLKKHTADLIQKYSLQQVPESFKKHTPIVDLEQGSKKIASEILKIKREQAEKQKTLKFTIKSTDKEALEEYDLKRILYQSMHANKSFNKNHANHRLYHALMEALIEDENAMDKGVADTVQDHRRKHDDDEDDDNEDPPAGPNQGKKTKRRQTKESESSKKPSSTKETPKGKDPSKGSKTGKSASAKEPVEEPIVEVVMDDAGDDVILDQPEQPWFNQMVSATKDPLTFNDLMATPIDFSMYVLNGLKIENLTHDILLGPAFSLLKGTCSSSIELEYNFQECFNALTDKLDWNDPKGYRYPFDLSKPLPLQGPTSHRTVTADYFFNNDLEYLKTSDP
ncbi:hypothetical protein Tco_0807226 [Tanacetum coccineum]